jgi:hypothetical protein
VETNLFVAISKITMSLSSFVNSKMPPKIYIFCPWTIAECPLLGYG